MKDHLLCSHPNSFLGPHTCAFGVQRPSVKTGVLFTFPDGDQGRKRIFGAVRRAGLSVRGPRPRVVPTVPGGALKSLTVQEADRLAFVDLRVQNLAEAPASPWPEGGCMYACSSVTNRCSWTAGHIPGDPRTRAHTGRSAGGGTDAVVLGGHQTHHQDKQLFITGSRKYLAQNGTLLGRPRKMWIPLCKTDVVP